MFGIPASTGCPLLDLSTTKARPGGPFVLERVMCCCEKPTINGEIGYKWQPDDNPIVRPVDPPMLGALEALLFDEPGRCGGLDCHSHHFRLVRGPGGSLGLMVRHGGGNEFFQLSTTKTFEQTVASLDSNARYWLLHTVYRAYKAGDQTGRNETAARWRLAAAEKRIKTRKERGGDSVKVWIEPRADVSSDEQHST
jgi:hypothetical protein